MDAWNNIWNNKKYTNSCDSIVDNLLSADGFDTGFGSINEKSWIRYVGEIVEKLGIESGDSVYEVGCGAGALLYVLKNNHNVRVGGLDYSSSLIEVAKNFVRSEDLECIEACRMDVKKKYDFVVSNSVFFYFPDYTYAESVLKRMASKCRNGMAILEVNDIEKKQEFLKMRMEFMSEAEYITKYAGLDHLFYSKDWFESILDGIGFTCEFSQQQIEGYKNNEYRFNVFARKR